MTTNARGDVRKGVVEAHCAAVATVLRQRFLNCRRGLPTPMVAPSQSAERPGDPQLHIHCLIPNLPRTRHHG